MGWKPLKSPDFFGDRLLPKEYQEVVKNFSASAERNEMNQLRSQLYRRWSQDKTLPPPDLLLALLYDRANDRPTAVRCIQNAVGQGYRDPAALADIARWELSIGDTAAARKHAEAAMKLWPNHPAAGNVLNQLDAANSAPD